MSGQRVLVVDGQPETEAVLKAVLEPRGLQVDRIRSSALGRQEAGTATPHVIVLHGEETASPGSDFAGWNSIPRVIIGSIELAADADGQATENRQGQRFLQKPFQYGELIHAIERFLACSSL